MTKAEQTREHICRVAMDLFLENGIAATEMKTIAQKAGVSRSTLYRSYETKDTLAFHVAEICLTRIFTQKIAPASAQGMSGYELLELCVHNIIDDLKGNVQMLKYLNEFDQTFTGEYPHIPQARNYVEFNRKNHDLLLKIIRIGIADGSIRDDKNPDLIELAIGNTLLGVSQRILPREANHQNEFGYGIDILYTAVEMLLAGIRTDKPGRQA